MCTHQDTVLRIKLGTRTWAGCQGGPPGGDVCVCVPLGKANKLVVVILEIELQTLFGGLTVPHRLYFMEVRTLPDVCF